MEKYSRYAVYYAPPQGEFAAFTASWLGWDAQAAEAVAHPDVSGLPLPVTDITATPRKYGFHGTIKPPFRLVDGSTREALEADLAALAAELKPVICDGLKLSRLGSFLALTIDGDTGPLAEMAGKIVRDLDHHRAAPSEAELARRKAAGLSARQEELLSFWGYPYVMDQFKFHLTLSGRLSGEDAIQVEQALAPVLAPMLPTPFVVSDLCLFGEAEDGRFHLLHRYALSG
ncbi:DUF1045 domain-containing protein [Celeribacter litoreus]|uniref:DUF1045 domain-containing protein n=1 Tax=Celeribacter litoreus TaxID=2876714 RepID=UPI001CCBE879|nr:DUF1045 domain-containing protein [Celeribacter litoreus]MCA0044774.1 DUF1045 domain-containing protein [Celeribacter litoreus]